MNVIALLAFGPSKLWIQEPMGDSPLYYVVVWYCCVSSIVQ